MAKKVAIIHDWLNGMRGGEKVLEEILYLFPGADIFTLFLEKKKISAPILAHRIVTSSLNRYGLIRKYYRHFLPLFPASIEEFNLQNYDLVISSSHCVAKGVIPAPQALHVGYIHSPMRYAWDQYYTYFGQVKGLKKAFIKRQISKLRTWDVASSSRVDHFVANSRFVQGRIWKYYRRDAAVIHPPVDTDFFVPVKNPERSYFLVVSALAPYKQIDLVIRTFNRSGERLLVVGKGPEEKRLRKIAGKNIEFKTNVSLEELRTLYQQARALVFAGIEDFGITFVEAQACGTPVVAYGRGGVVDIVPAGCGILFDRQSEEALAEATIQVKQASFDPSILRQNSLQFSKEIFRDKFKRMIEEKS